MFKVKTIIYIMLSFLTIYKVFIASPLIAESFNTPFEYSRFQKIYISTKDILES